MVRELDFFLTLLLLFDHLVGAVTVWRVAGMFALAEVGCFCLFGLKHDRRETGALVISIAKGLIFGLSARAIGVFLAFFQFNLFRKTGGDFRFFHSFNSANCL